MNVLFRCDASKEIGFGHLIRCLALGYEFKKKGCNIAFAVNKNTTVKKIIQNNQYAIFEKNNQNYTQWLFNTIKKFQTDLLILDVRDNLDRQTLLHIKRDFNIKIATIDDPCEKRLACDYAFYPPVKQLESMDWSGFSGKLYVGFEWVILRRQFLEYKNKHTSINNQLKIFINAGATDPHCITPIITKALNNLEIEFEATIVIGALFCCEKKLYEALKHANYTYNVFKNPKNIASIMHTCDLAVTSFGSSAYELACLGVPAIFLCISKDHSLSASMFEEKGFALNLGEYKKVSQTEIGQAILKLAKNADLRYSMAQKAKKSVDGFGALRITEEILKRVELYGIRRYE